tara:strand:+ start:9538 stop:9948 length:411 start_codon:yes stop_codon:yes gene_type:complete
MTAIATELEVHRNTIGDWVKLYKNHGSKAITSKPRGRKKGSGKKLSLAQEKDIQKVIIDKDPNQMKLEFALWTREAVLELIKQICGLDLQIRTVGNYLNNWGFTRQRLAKRAYRREDKKCRKMAQRRVSGNKREIV